MFSLLKQRINNKIFILFFLIPVESNSQNWMPLNSGLTNTPRVMYADTIEQYLYVTGIFRTVDGIPTKGIARWNGLSWDSLGAGIDGFDSLNNPPNHVSSISRFGNKLLVTGYFNSLGNLWIKNIGTWDGISWDSLSMPPVLDQYGRIHKAQVINSDLYISGSFDSINGIEAHSISKWNGNNWISLNMPDFCPPSCAGQNASITTIIEFNGSIIISGSIYSMPIDTVGDILSYDGNRWITLNGGIKGLNSGVSDMIVYQNELYVAGYFFQSDGNAGSNIQKWNGSSWSDVGGGTGIQNGSIYKLLIFHDKLYALGVFETAGSIPAQRIAMWDGTKWCGLGTELVANIGCGAIFHDSLFVGGGFNLIDSIPLNGIAKWNGGDFIDTCSSSVGVTEINIQEYKLSPNPTFNSIEFESVNQPDRIVLSDNTGNKINVILNPSNREIIDMRNLISGIYFLQVYWNSNVTSQKIIKME